MANGKLPKTLTEDEQDKLLDQPNPRYPTGERNLVMLRVMLNAGLRLSEVTALRWVHIDLMSGKVMIREGKGSKDRALWLGNKDIASLKSWKQRQIEETGAEPEHVFTTLEGKQVMNRYVQAMIARYGKKAGIDKQVHPHMLRHTFASDLYRESKNIRITQKALGHTDLSTTMIYTHIVDDELEGALKSFRGAKEQIAPVPV